jgi:signal transduction histidine kinase
LLDVFGDPAFPLALLRDVLRTGEEAILEALDTQLEYADDPYVASRSPKSVVCLPLLQGNETVGLLYLENNQITGAFTPEQLAFLRPLAAQAIISIGVAERYGGLEDKVRVRTSELELASAELAQALEAAELAARAKPVYRARVAREAHTPVIEIMELSRLALATELTPPQRDSLDKILGTAETLLGLLNDMPDPSQGKAGIDIDSGLHHPLDRVSFYLRR